MRDVLVLKTSKIVGMTITGCAKYSSLLEKLKSPITIIEEAAEVLESHCISVLTYY
jgi:helicase required for RNAi-mediated heterochromatin assembly 1